MHSLHLRLHLRQIVFIVSIVFDQENFYIRCDSSTGLRFFIIAGTCERLDCGRLFVSAVYSRPCCSPGSVYLSETGLWTLQLGFSLCSALLLSAFQDSLVIFLLRVSRYTWSLTDEFSEVHDSSRKITTSVCETETSPVGNFSKSFNNKNPGC